MMRLTSKVSSRLILSTLVAVQVLIGSSAFAHDGGHGGGHDGGGHSGGFDAGHHDDFGGEHFHNAGNDFNPHFDNAGHFRHRRSFLDNFDQDGDDCYPEWFYDRESAPYRSAVCPD